MAISTDEAVLALIDVVENHSGDSKRVLEQFVKEQKATENDNKNRSHPSSSVRPTVSSASKK
jgi:hypothetical protein